MAKNLTRESDPQPQRPSKVGAGYVFYVEFTPHFPEMTTRGNIVLPSIFVTGEKQFSDMIWGKVVACGDAANRTTIEPFHKDQQDRMQFPLLPGSTIAMRKGNHWTLCGQLKGLQTFDVAWAFPPERSWDSIVEELMQLANLASAKKEK